MSEISLDKEDKYLQELPELFDALSVELPAEVTRRGMVLPHADFLHREGTHSNRTEYQCTALSPVEFLAWQID